MADAYTKLGAAGVDIVRNKYSPDDTTVLSAQNAELVFDKSLGGKASLRKRGGYPATGAAFSSGIFEMYEVKFIEADQMTPDPPPGSVTEFIRPIADSSPGVWVTSPLWSKLDETVFDDTDFIRSDASLLSVGTCNGTMVSFTGSATAGTFRIRARLGAGTPPAGAQAGVILDQSLVMDITPSLTTSFQTFEFDLFTDLGYSGDPFDWSTIVFSFLRSSGSAARFEISWMELELTHAT